MLTPRILLPRVWRQKRHPLGYLLAPLSWPFCLAVSMRRLAYRKRLIATRHPGIPVIVVGNISAGGTGKTPLVIRLAKLLHGRFRPAIVARGYGGKARHWPQRVEADSDPYRVGDEAVLLARRAACPVFAAPDRVAAIEASMEATDCNLILCDDGLQHYALARDLEIAVVDGVLGHGNGRCLPAGPLREPVSRLATVDFVVRNMPARDLASDSECNEGEYAMRLIPGAPRNVADERAESLDAFRGSPVHAVCGIGHPERFFGTLRQLGLAIHPHAFPDHHAFAPDELAFEDDLPIFMTEKDAVKCRRFAEPRHWCLPVAAEWRPAFETRLLEALSRIESSMVS
uniref:Tetraacyldisaccharide 4'-kinase n=1 Tax=Candidatus Kentrum sp. LPFa TaxID=2126335 RepID=A0A450VVV1_9GAMM|nr:MAG: lipid-A-disaccharide kinase [Candidatus Kentron sp. LPFa]VFK33539.1 MAG: lipid-A-disaccharide kinase [Candidatus Kentron sp. LPFa]